MAHFQMGLGTHSVPMSLFRKNREKVCQALAKLPDIPEHSFVLMEGGRAVNFNDTDVQYVFRQESFFQYLFGVKEPDCFGVLDIKSEKTTLFVPRLPADYATWMGRLLMLDEFKSIYETDHILYVDELNAFFENMANVNLILTLSGTNSDSGLTSRGAYFPGIEKFKVNSVLLHPVLAECRVIKSPEEIDVLRYVAKVSSDAHIKVMESVSPGHTEYQCESTFLHHCYSVGGCRHTSYTCICGTGRNSSILHYGHAAAPNDRTIRDGDMCLLDMGANYCGYAADITCSFPVNGKFTEDQKFIYNAVLSARNAVLKEAREGVSWVELHKLACCVLMQCLKEGSMLRGNVDEMITAGLPGIFQPHGLGHLLGLDVHDVGGYLKGQPERPKELWLSKLRFARTLKAGMYVTVEPGCYFIDHLMDRALEDPNLNKFINADVFERFRNFGGVRIEDDVLIKENGNENFAIVPRSVAEIEALMKKT